MALLSELTGQLTALAGKDKPGAISSQTISGELMLGPCSWVATTAPAGLTKSYIWTQVGNVVYMFWCIKASTPGLAVSAVTNAFPTDAPQPWVPPMLSNDSWLFMGSGAVLSAANAATPTQPGCGIYKDTLGTLQLRIYGATSLAANFAMGSVIYLTAA